MINSLRYLNSKLTILFFCAYALVSSCSFFKKNEAGNERIVARVFDKKLLWSELETLIPSGTSKEDSTKIADSYIDNWIRQEVVLKKADSYLENDSLRNHIDKQLEDYRNSLIRFAYEKEFVSQKLDTTVSEQEISNYYNTNKDNFELKDNIIKVIYLKVNRKSPKINKVKEWYKSDKEQDVKLLEDYCHQFAENFFLDQDTWLLFDDLIKEIPIRTYDKEQFLKNNRFVEIQDSTYYYFVNIKGFKIKDSTSPLVFEHDNIINIILNKRKLVLIEEMEKSAYDEAIKKNDIEIIKN